jgi:hypothetical protein
LSEGSENVEDRSEARDELAARILVALAWVLPEALLLSSVSLAFVSNHARLPAVRMACS